MQLVLKDNPKKKQDRWGDRKVMVWVDPSEAKEIFPDQPWRLPHEISPYYDHLLEKMTEHFGTEKIIPLPDIFIFLLKQLNFKKRCAHKMLRLLWRRGYIRKYRNKKKGSVTGSWYRLEKADWWIGTAVLTPLSQFPLRTSRMKLPNSEIQPSSST